MHSQNRYASTRLAVSELSFDRVAQHMQGLMARNFAGAGWVFEAEGRRSRPGCIIASPSRPAEGIDVTDQDYVHFWVRDGAICLMEAAAAGAPRSTLEDHVEFSKRIQDQARASGVPIGHACFRIDGSVRPWSVQNDGPAMRITSLVSIRSRLSPDSRALADQVLRTDLEYLLEVYPEPTRNLWEEADGWSFFTRAVQLRALSLLLKDLTALGLEPYQAAITKACDHLSAELAGHWSPENGHYRSMIGNGPGAGLDSDVIMAATYADWPASDPRMLATGAQVRALFLRLYPINEVDAARGIGPLIGRYQEDTYDGDQSDGTPDEGHPWVICSANFAELYYRVAAEARGKGRFTVAPGAREFFQQIGFTRSGLVEGPALDELVKALVHAGDRILRAILHHSDHLELSEQFDRYTGFEKSVRNLTWSYAAVLSAVRTRAAVGRRGEPRLG